MLIHELRRYDPRGRLRKNRLFDPFFGAFYPHSAHKSALRTEGPPSLWHPGNLVGPQRPTGHCSPAPRPTTPDQRGRAGHRPSPSGYCLTPTGRVAGRYCYLPAPSELDVRVAPHPAQAFTNAPCGTWPLLRNGLHDTRLEPTDRTPDLAPVNGVPVGRTFGSRTSGHFCRRHICLSPRVGWPRFSRDGTPEGSQLAFAVRKCCPWEDSPSIRSTTERHSLPPSSLPRYPIGFLCRKPTLAGRQRGFFVHLLDQPGVRSCLSAGGAPSATGEFGAPVPDHLPFGSSLTAS